MGKKKKEKVVDLKPENVSEEELKELQQVVSAINKLQFGIGLLGLSKPLIFNNHATFSGAVINIKSELFFLRYFLIFNSFSL